MFCPVERLAAVFEGEAAGFEQVDFGSAFGQLQGQQKAGYACADDAEAALAFPVGWQLLEIDVHGSSSLPSATTGYAADREIMRRWLRNTPVW